jgi:uncharacterized protein (TIGR02466 family)
MLVKLGADLSVIFGTRVFLRKSFLEPATNLELEKAVRSRAAAGKGVRVSNVGGWQSQPDLFDWPEAAVARLGAELNLAVQQFVSFGRPAMEAGKKELKIWKAGWANINRAGDYNILHNHPAQDLAAVYYVKAGGPNASGSGGRLELRDPRPAAGFCNFPKLFSAEPLQITPEPGMLVMFPSWIEHMVHPHHDPDDRISLAINIKLMDFED